ncbi:MAG: DNA mismatch repair protein MutS [Flavobacteriaceae bacterium]|nr:DNA mismatch repair protein MutS [Flavobacteriaceae bacterium]|tara:strand:+ start:2706 stop:4856 length:2151 start_codon:yes stop_codon:yes gene_type:complete
MSIIPNKTFEDLEFDKVLNQISSFSITPMAKDLILDLKPIEEYDEIKLSLLITSEFKSSFENDNKIPNHGFESLNKPIQLLKIDNSVLDVESFRNIAHASETVNNLLYFFKKFKIYYPNLFSIGSKIELNKELKTNIDKVINRFGEINDNASDKLFLIRKQSQEVKSKISKSFNKSLSHYNKLDFLDQIRESVIDNKRVLAVKSMYRRKVKGSIMGSSKTGSIVFIEPEATYALSRELQNLIFEEDEEIKKILSQLTDYFRSYRYLIKNYNEYLINLDLYYSKAKYSTEINGIMPNISNDNKMELFKAYHPLLLKSNKTEKKITYPQTVFLNNKNRIIVISGPNAGGKSITLKTVGLLQVMVQTGILIPVEEKSTICLFKKILTDIGDNQSIENHLSTYSYRLKNMKVFLTKCDEDTLFLIDEFGTGSDPELGGALAEVMLEEFYNRKSFGLITTHYSNLKLLANELPFMSNANMQFDNKSLEPTFKLISGEAGSSFTFEVAQKNGFPFSLINRAKKKIENQKIRFDATIAKLQKERSSMAKTGKSLKEKEIVAEEESSKLALLNSKTKEKLIRYQELYDHNKRMIIIGNKLDEIAEKYFISNKKRNMISNVIQLIESENSKRKKKSTKEIINVQKIIKLTHQEAEKKFKNIKINKKKGKKLKEAKPLIELKVGYNVRLTGSKSIGTIDSIQKNKAIVNYGKFTTQVDLEKLEYVK